MAVSLSKQGRWIVCTSNLSWVQLKDKSSILNENERELATFSVQTTSQKGFNYAVFPRSSSDKHPNEEKADYIHTQKIQLHLKLGDPKIRPSSQSNLTMHIPKIGCSLYTVYPVETDLRNILRVQTLHH